MTRSTTVRASARFALRTSMPKPACLFRNLGKMVSQTSTGHQSFNNLHIKKKGILECDKHTLVTHIAVLHHSSALLVKYSTGHDGQPGWFLPNDDLHHLEHPDQAAKRILKEHVGVEDATLKLVEIESFVGNNETWASHLRLSSVSQNHESINRSDRLRREMV